MATEMIRLPICLSQVLLREIVQISELKDMAKEESARLDISQSQPSFFYAVA